VPQLVDWNTVPSEWFNLVADPPPTWINELSRATSDVGDAVIMDKIVAKVREGHRASP
jgi:hypothetical protein